MNPKLDLPDYNILQKKKSLKKKKKKKNLFDGGLWSWLFVTFCWDGNVSLRMQGSEEEVTVEERDN
jgi:hypothetical protein